MSDYSDKRNRLIHYKDKGAVLRKKRSSWLLAGGILGPVMHVIVVAVLSHSAPPHYDWMRKAISILGMHHYPDAWSMNWFGFVIPGVVFVLFSVGLFQCLHGFRGRFGAFLLAISGVHWILAGFITLPSLNHMLLALSLFLITPIALWLLSSPIAAVLEYRGWYLLSWIMGAIMISGIISVWDVRYGGLWQRISIGNGLLWTVVVAVGLMWSGRGVEGDVKSHCWGSSIKRPGKKYHYMT